MMFKILLAASTAIIVGLLLFPPRSGSDQREPSRPLASNQGLNPPRDPLASGGSPNRNDLEEGDFKMGSQLEQQIRLKAEAEYQEVQAQLRSILDSEPVHVAVAQKLLQNRRRKVLLAKVALLGQESFGGKLPRSPENKLTLQLLDKELNLVSEQFDLLARADHKD